MKFFPFLYKFSNALLRAPDAYPGSSLKGGIRAPRYMGQLGVSVSPINHNQGTIPDNNSVIGSTKLPERTPVVFNKNPKNKAHPVLNRRILDSLRDPNAVSYFTDDGASDTGSSETTSSNDSTASNSTASQSEYSVTSGNGIIDSMGF